MASASKPPVVTSSAVETTMFEKGSGLVELKAVEQMIPLYEAQAEIAELLVKSTSAICAAIGAQPIPLADLPILTTLQLVMVSGLSPASRPALVAPCWRTAGGAGSPGDWIRGSSAGYAKPRASIGPGSWRDR